MCSRVLVCVLASCLHVAASWCIASESAPTAANELVRIADAKGGLAIHVGCGDGKLIADLAKAKGWLVHGLDVSQEQVRSARDRLRSVNAGSTVSVARFDGQQLPYIDNLVKLAIVESAVDV